MEVVLIAREGRARLEVRDAGPGVPADYLPCLFQAHRQHSHEKGGAGLGLFISKGIAEAHGGTIWCENEEGKGACFISEIPLRQNA